MRLMSVLELSVNDYRPLLLHSSTERNYSQLVELTFPYHVPEGEGAEQRQNLSIQRFRVLPGALRERIRVRNFGQELRHLRLQVDFAADFLDIFEIRGLVKARRGEVKAPRVEDDSVVLGYGGLDGKERTTTIRFSP